MDAQSKENLSVIKYPNKILRAKTLPVEKITEEIFSLADRMIKTMLKYDGVGLAASQVGKLYRIFVINTVPLDEKPKPITVLNPEIIDKEGSLQEEEGCLSFPSLYLKIQRAEKVRVQMQNLYNEKLILEVEGLLARAVIHEIDHLNGILFIDYVEESEKEKLNNYLKVIATQKAG